MKVRCVNWVMIRSNKLPKITEKLQINDCGLASSNSVRAQLKILVRRTLQRWKYPPDKAAEAIELVMKQAEMLSNAWTTS